jgi:hypothetical protein
VGGQGPATGDISRVAKVISLMASDVASEALIGLTICSQSGAGSARPQFELIAAYFLGVV